MNTPYQTLDVHAHILELETIQRIADEVPEVRITLTKTEEDFGDLDVQGVVYRQFPRGGWDVERRLTDMKRFGFDQQVLAVPPQSLFYDVAPEICLKTSRIQNDAIAKLVRDRPAAFQGLATVPMQAPEMAADELARAMTDDGLSGVMIATNVNGQNLDMPELDPFWASAERLGAFILVHPAQVAGVDRQKDYYLKNFIGNPLDTTIAAACLVFGGVLERYPELKVCLSHGGGFVPYQAARWIHGWGERKEAKVRLKGHPGPSIDRLLYDTILHDGAPLQYLVDWAGSKRVMLGSDYPFDMGQYDLREVIGGLRLTTAERGAILGCSARALIPPAS